MTAISTHWPMCRPTACVRNCWPINGIGAETADSIVLYALDKPTFVVDTYTARLLGRHGVVWPDCDYQELKDTCESLLPADMDVYKECHALIVAVGKEFCRPRPRCDQCAR